MAGPATMHQRIAQGYGTADDVLPGDTALLVPLRQSTEYEGIHQRVTSEWPIDSWQEDGFHYFVFQLLPGDNTGDPLLEAPVAVFAMHPESTQPISAVLVGPLPGSEKAEVVNLRQTDQTYTAPISA